MNDHGSHKTREFLRYCNDHKIVPFAYLPHTTHLVQPLDVVVFQPYKHYHRDIVARATRTGFGEFDKIEFLAAIKSIRNQTFKDITIKSAWRKTGIIPFKPSVVLDQLLPIEPPYESRYYDPSVGRPNTPPKLPNNEEWKTTIVGGRNRWHSAICDLCTSPWVCDL